MKIEIQHRVYLYGASVLIVDGLAYLLATLRTPHIDPTGSEFFFYMFVGGPLGIIALVLLSHGSGRGRVVLVLRDLIALYLWFSYVSFQVMLH
jgi:hypothetical protein